MHYIKHKLSEIANKIATEASERVFNGKFLWNYKYPFVSFTISYGIINRGFDKK